MKKGKRDCDTTQMSPNGTPKGSGKMSANGTYTGSSDMSRSMVPCKGMV